MLTKEEIESICSSLNESLYTEEEKHRLVVVEARFCGNFMYNINKYKLASPSWSLRDICKIFERLKNQNIYHENFEDIGTPINLLFYALSATSKDRINKDNVDKLIKLLKEIFKERIKEEDLQKVFHELPTLYNEIDIKTQIRKYYIKKHNSLVLLDKIDESSKRNEKENNKQKKLLKKYALLPNFLEVLFKMKLSDFSEPLLLSGPTCYKTYASKIILKNAVTIKLSNELTISQLLGKIIFFSPFEDKRFCLKLIYEILDVPNVEDELKKIDKWEKNKNEILKSIKNYIQKSDSENFDIITNIKNKMLEKIEENLIDMKIEFNPGLILSAVIKKKSLILKDLLIISKGFYIIQLNLLTLFIYKFFFSLIVSFFSI